MPRIAFHAIHDSNIGTVQVYRLQNTDMVFARAYIVQAMELQSMDVEWYATFFTDEQKKQILLDLKEKLKQTWDSS